ncbi:MAG TPA: TolC family protein [Pyrinomonadaceae bacterium]|nr:TolC family protein [Pyrinomonadaceae bacterium]
MMNPRKTNRLMVLSLALSFAFIFTFAEKSSAQEGQQISSTSVKGDSATAKIYLDLQNGMTGDAAVKFALENNGEILALRQEVEAAKSLVKQAALKPNPMFEASGAQQIGGTDNNLMVQGSLPLELGGRRSARIAVAQADLEIREFALANQERLLAAEVRSKFGEVLSTIKKVELLERIMANTRQGYQIITAKVTEGRTAPLEQNMLLVEVNRLRSMRETSEGKVEAAMFELKNLIGMKPETLLRLSGDFEDLIDNLPPVEEFVTNALRDRPDFQGARAMEKLAVARLNQARSESKVDASLKTGYQRMKSGFPLNGITDTGALQPIESVFHYFTFGVEINLPVRNRNQGMIEAAVYEQQAAQSRIQFGELTVRREVNVAYARYNRAVRALTIFQSGVRDQASVNLQAIWQTYEFGKRTLSDYIAEERRFLDIETELTDALLETYLAKIEIKRSTNTPKLIIK